MREILGPSAGRWLVREHVLLDIEKRYAVGVATAGRDLREMRRHPALVGRKGPDGTRYIRWGTAPLDRAVRPADGSLEAYHDGF